MRVSSAIISNGPASEDLVSICVVSAAVYLAPGFCLQKKSPVAVEQSLGRRWGSDITESVKR